MTPVPCTPPSPSSVPARSSRRCWRPPGNAACAAPSAPWSAGVLAGLRRTIGPMERRRPRRPAPHRRPHGAPASSPACAAPLISQGAPASSPASATPLAPWSAGVLAGLRRTIGPMERRRPRRPPPHRPPHGAPASSPASATPSAPWSAGVLAGLRHTVRPMGRRRPRRPPPHRPPHGAPASSPACATPSAPWSAGVLAGLRRTVDVTGRHAEGDRRDRMSEPSRRLAVRRASPSSSASG